MHRRCFALAALGLAALAVTSCGGGGTTTPVDTNPDPNKDRLEITISYGSGVSASSMDLFQITKDGRLATPLVSAAGAEMLPEWSSDGKKLVYTSIVNGVATLWTVNADLTGLKQLIVDPNPPANSFNNQLYGSWSPDGASIAFYRSIAGSQVGIAVMSADGSNVRWLAPLGDSPSWSSTTGAGSRSSTSSHPSGRTTTRTSKS